MKVFFPQGTIRHAHIYEPHTFTKEGPERFMVVVEAEYLKGFKEFDDFFANTPHVKDKSFVKISSTARVEIDTNSYDMLKRYYDINQVCNRPFDRIFKEHDTIVELDMVPMPKNALGYVGFVLVLKGITINFSGMGNRIGEDVARG